MAEPRQPTWRWDDKAHGLIPCCPKCAEPLITSYGRLLCHIMGEKHYKEDRASVVAAAVGQLDNPLRVETRAPERRAGHD